MHRYKETNENLYAEKSMESLWNLHWVSHQGKVLSKCRRVSATNLQTKNFVRKNTDSL